MTKPLVSRKSSKSIQRDGSLANEIAEAAAPIPETIDESALESAYKVSTDLIRNEDAGMGPLPAFSTDQ